MILVDGEDRWRERNAQFPDEVRDLISRRGKQPSIAPALSPNKLHLHGQPLYGTARLARTASSWCGLDRCCRA